MYRDRDKIRVRYCVHNRLNEARKEASEINEALRSSVKRKSQNQETRFTKKLSGELSTGGARETATDPLTYSLLAIGAFAAMMIGLQR